MEYRVLDNIEKFIFGGKSEFTIRNEVSGKGAKYHIKKKGDLYFVSVKDGNSYVYAGFIKKDSRDNEYKYIRGNKGSYDTTTPEVKALVWVIKHSSNMDNRISVMHHGKCACCGRTLDDEESIRRGFGPICAQKMFAF